ncbi:MAG: endonuclease/exonuclease/phosphatase family protein [Planctomycetes bacterium]|nr:endonuclease/exonuclease/phosphatase family protein [Planctomycetota bacterium]
MRYLETCRRVLVRAAATLCVGVLFVVTLAWMPRAARAILRVTPGPHPALPADELVVHSFNVFGLPWPVGDVATARCAILAGRIVDERPDVVALQEVWDATAREPLLVPGYHAAWCDSPQGLLGQSGLLTLSRFPVLEAKSFAFTGGSGLEALVGKGALRTVLAVSLDQRLAVWNVHLQSGDAQATRLRQLDELCGWIAAAGDEPRVVVGDFNCGPGCAEWPTFVTRLGAVGVVLGSGDQCTYDCRVNPLAAPEPPAGIDHVFVDRRAHGGHAPGWRIHDRPTDGRFLSDHFGVAVRLPIRSSAFAWTR